MLSAQSNLDLFAGLHEEGAILGAMASRCATHFLNELINYVVRI